MTLPMLASDAVDAKLRFPVWVQPKVDGVRGLNLDGTLTGRSLKKFANQHVTNLFSSIVAFQGMDGEMAAEFECNPDLCRLTTSALTTISGTPWILWHVFDYITPASMGLPYRERYSMLGERVEFLSKRAPEVAQHLRVMPTNICNNIEQLLELEAYYLEAGYEGLIIRDPEGRYKPGRSTVKEGGLLRVKRFIDAEAVVTGLVEGEANGNEAQTNELGLQFRSTHKANMVPNGMLGSMTARVVTPVKKGNEVLLAEGQVITVAPGKMKADERGYYMRHPEQLIGKTIKFQFFPKGIKDKPRFPTFQGFRSTTDMS